MTTVYCVRHGQSTANAGGVTMEHAAIPLSRLGIAQAEALAGLLDAEPSRILVSNYVRALATAAPYCARVGRQAEVHPLLHEFSALDTDQLQGMMGVQRRPLADAYWAAADPRLRSGPKPETFAEFSARVDAFVLELAALPDRSVLVGHGIWFGLLFWKLMGFTADESAGMRAFRRFQTSLPMPNCAVYELDGPHRGHRWNLRADEAAMRAIAGMEVPAGSRPLDASASSGSWG